VVEIDRLNAQSEGRTKYEANQFADLTATGMLYNMILSSGKPIDQPNATRPPEFEQRMLLPSRTAPSFPTERYAAPLADKMAIPSAYDWRNFNATTPVRDQGSTGSFVFWGVCVFWCGFFPLLLSSSHSLAPRTHTGTCWAFSTIESIER
jgi:C1A family cysteine protease